MSSELWFHEQLVKDVFCTEDAKIILSLPLCNHAEDFLAWHPGPKGIFSVKSTYALGIRICDQQYNCGTACSSSAGTGFQWKKIWTLDVANKVTVVVWRLAYNSLQVKMNIARRGVSLDTLCPICLRFDEDSGHLFF